MKYSVCIDALYAGKDIYESIGAVKAAGINTIEFWSWANGKDLSGIKKFCDDLEMNISTFCTSHTNLTNPDERPAYITGLKESVKAARFAGAHMLITTVGQDTGKPRIEQKKCIIKGLKAVSGILENSGIVLIIEPLNTIADHKGHYLDSSEEAFEIVDEVGSENIKVLFDIYHQQITEGNIIARITENISKIAHFHAAGIPGRHELDSGEIYYPSVFKAIYDSGYSGYIGLEYFPLEKTECGLTRLLQISKHKNFSSCKGN